MRFTTIREIDAAGFDLRLWCYACCRGRTIEGIIWMTFEERGWSMHLDKARQRFPCRRCGARDCLILPAKLKQARPKGTKSMVVAMFFFQRSIGKGHDPGRERHAEFELRGGLAPARMDWRWVRRWSPPSGELHLVPPGPRRPRRR